MKTKQIAVPFECKDIGDEGQVDGYASVFGVIDSYRDVVMPGAFVRSIVKHREKGSMPALLWQHRSDTPIGVWQQIDEDDKGLHVRGRLAMGTAKGREVRELLKMGALRGLSIGFNVPEGGEEYDHVEKVNRLKEINLWETSIVTFPANEAANIESVRSAVIDEALKTKRNLERFLRDAGLPWSVCKQLASAYKVDAPCDEGDMKTLELVKQLETRLRMAS